ncbi:MBL fold metallo-hydrolase [Desulfosoma caldarium]|uniref:Glyoxylase-like metal-dependent hydrolase (Beta-lactamase superfamily II) n=1 Tax=Desulfosoma caldarium TaxID=610254 RepID=A0A3N1VJW7_9BACT|nr:MBL fold metallo-hydrolase [Desulfosoma caldarium]ROR03104.1 glyoxylase-like metal-dependent hydrolase (beta-lactamase superfamily II) [Desulfosoma caldarium]
MILERLVVGMLQTNCYLLCDEETRQGVVIDPGGEASRIIGRLQELDVTLVAILNTHGHFDHVLDAWALKEALGGLIFLHPKDEPLLMDHKVGLGAVFTAATGSSHGKVDEWLEEGAELSFGNLRLKVLETPGHTPGHVAFHLPEAKVLFVGDTLFAGSIGRTDFPGGSYTKLIQSVKDKIFPMDDATRVLPGHGPETTVGIEKRTNPFF